MCNIAATISAARCTGTATRGRQSILTRRASRTSGKLSVAQPSQNAALSNARL